jgi:thiamine-monophosphate kinase
VTDRSSVVRATIGEVGEKAYLAGLLPRLTPHPSLRNGFGDDAAVIIPERDLGAVVHKIDRAARPVVLDFDPGDYAAWGRMAVTANCSDLLSCAATPISFMLAVLAPPQQLVDDIDRIILAAEQECRDRGIAFSGGDLKESRALEVIGSAVGVVAPGSALTRNGLAAGDTLYCAGLVGGFAAATLLLRDPTLKLDDELRRECLNYLSHPEAQWTVGRLVGSSGLAHAAMDASDGLYDSFSVLANGQVGIVVDLDHPGYHPLTSACERYTGIDQKAQMFGAGDWNIVYAVAPRNVDAFDRLAQDSSLFRIGEVVDDPGVVGRAAARSVTIQPMVHEHFRSRLEQEGDFLEVIRTGGPLEWA